MKQLSVITINYNNLKGLEKTVNSVVGQTFFDKVEYLVIDGGSTDGSKEYIESVSGKIAYWVSEQDKGVYNAMNKGVLKANGEYLLFLNSGDVFYENNTVEKSLPHLKDDLGFVYGGVMLDKKLKNRFKCYPDVLSFSFFRRSMICHQSIYTKRSLFTDYFMYNEKNKIVSDWEFLIVLICKENISYKRIPGIISLYDTTGISSQKQNSEVSRLEKSNVLDKYFPLFVNDYEDISLISRKRFSHIKHIKKHPIAWRFLKNFISILLLFLPKIKRSA